MDYKNIDGLIEKYFNGESSREEEKLINNFFQSELSNSEKYRQEKTMFSFFASEKELKSELIIENVMRPGKKSGKSRRMYFYAMAASIALLISFFFLQENRPQEQVLLYINGQPVENQEIAMAEAQKALLLISKNLNEGTENLDYLTEFGKAEAILSNE